ncbi:heterokaryon incompatibility protein-domain-containing protein [Cercophora newfieldiana]|uniref:Heterokaryon incompatibility protein-domain-containing protein n=1 Tax=Cercophora newfieldiana TaxID=92897 RepID=A0AA39Y3I6_9PEZI|nr:heterokaryon incompatibility protein-domain-containing protein [Cercophora newfieldiana]
MRTDLNFVFATAICGPIKLSTIFPQHGAGFSRSSQRFNSLRRSHFYLSPSPSTQLEAPGLGAPWTIMRLLDVSNVGNTEEFVGSGIPRYAILSHTWEDEEVAFQQLGDPQSRPKKGYAKIERTCDLAARHGFSFAWVDTCCIDKSSSAELSEAINSMFYWYQQADVCYVYLSDLDPEATLSSDLRHCRWFTRGWTLQELIAPRNVRFYDSTWTFRGTKVDLSSLIEEITGIPEDILHHRTEPSDYAVAQRMSWASRRETTRVEDTAYCLLGIFDVHMSPRYGEREKAFLRLQNVIIEQSAPDATILAWMNPDDSGPSICGVLATSPSQFQGCHSLQKESKGSTYRPLRATAREIEVSTVLILSNSSNSLFLSVGGTIDDAPMVIALRKVGANLYARASPAILTDFVFDYVGLPKASVILAGSLPKTFPFHPSDAVLGSRHTTLSMHNSMSKRLESLGAQCFLQQGVPGPFPFSHWDPQECLFFSTEGLSWGWGLFSFEFEVKVTSSQVWREGFFVACFDWNSTSTSRPARAMMIATSSIPRAERVLLQSRLSNLGFENEFEANDIIQELCGDRITEDSLTVEVPVSPRKTALVAIKALVEKVSRPDLCATGRSIQLTIRMEPLSESGASGRRIEGGMDNLSIGV